MKNTEAAALISRLADDHLGNSIETGSQIDPVELAEALEMASTALRDQPEPHTTPLTIYLNDGNEVTFSPQQYVMVPGRRQAYLSVDGFKKLAEAGVPVPTLTLEEPHLRILPADVEEHEKHVEGWACPRCGDSVIVMSVAVEVKAGSDGSAEVISEVLEWADDAPCRCNSCDWRGYTNEAVGIPSQLDGTGVYASF